MLNRAFLNTLIGCAALALCSIPLQSAAPKGWFLAGSKPAEYDTGVDSDSAAYLKAKKDAVEGFGTLMQSFRAEQYLGKRVRFRAAVKSENVTEWAGLWMRVDKGTAAVAFDNMQDRPVKGTLGWHEYEVVLDVPQDATGISFGILLAGPGEVWISGLRFEIVDSTVPKTGRPTGLPDAPANLSLEK